MSTASKNAMFEFLHNMFYQALNIENDEIFIKFKVIAQLINDINETLIERNNQSIQISDVMNTNILNEINNYEFIFDVRTEMEIQDNVDKMMKKATKPPSPPPPYTPPPELIGKIEIDNLRQQLNEEFLRNAIAISKTELDTENKRANEKNKELIKSIVNPTPNLLNETKVKAEDKNIHNNVKKSYVLPPTMRNRLDEIIDENKKIIFQPPLKENIPKIPTEDIYIHDDFTSLKKPETKINIGKPNFDGDNIKMIPNNDKAEIKKIFATNDN